MYFVTSDRNHMTCYALQSMHYHTLSVPGRESQSKADERRTLARRRRHRVVSRELGNQVCLIRRTPNLGNEQWRRERSEGAGLPKDSFKNSSTPHISSSPSACWMERTPRTSKTLSRVPRKHNKLSCILFSALCMIIVLALFVLRKPSLSSLP